MSNKNEDFYSKLVSEKNERENRQLKFTEIDDFLCPTPHLEEYLNRQIDMLTSIEKLKETILNLIDWIPYGSIASLASSVVDIIIEIVEGRDYTQFEMQYLEEYAEAAKKHFHDS